MLKKLARLGKEAPTDGMSRLIIYGFAILSAIVFGLFFFVGYDNIYDENTDFNAPLFTDAVIVLAYVMLALAVITVSISIFCDTRTSNRLQATPNRISPAMVNGGVAAAVALTLAATYILASDTPAIINGNTFDDITWLRLTDMFVNTIIILMCGAVVLILAGNMLTSIKKKQQEK